MQSKLTLRLDDYLIRRAKTYAQRSGKSLSQMVADYFALLDQSDFLDEASLPPVTQSLYGSLARAALDESDYHRHLEDKYQ